MNLLNIFRRNRDQGFTELASHPDSVDAGLEDSIRENIFSGVSFEQCDRIIEEIGTSTNFTLGLVWMGSGTASLNGLIEELARRSSRTTYCISGGNSALPGSFSGYPIEVPESGASDVHVFYDAWDTDTSAAAANSWVKGIRQLPVLKSRFPLIAFQLGNFGSEWIEPLGRLCDVVYLIVPDRGALSPSRSVACVGEWTRAGLPIRGTWIARAA